MFFESVFWNFLESSHGKGPADGIGAAVKNMADRQVAHGKDVLDIEQFMSALSDTLNVSMSRIGAQDMEEYY